MRELELLREQHEELMERLEENQDMIVLLKSEVEDIQVDAEALAEKITKLEERVSEVGDSL